MAITADGRMMPKEYRSANAISPQRLWVDDSRIVWMEASPPQITRISQMAE